jgi:hypothetical protein
MPEEGPGVARLKAASEAWTRAGAARAALGGYVPLNNPNHPSRWSAARRAQLAAADADVARTAAELNEARAVNLTLSPPDEA